MARHCCTTCIHYEVDAHDEPCVTCYATQELKSWERSPGHEKKLQDIYESQQREVS